MKTMLNIKRALAIKGFFDTVNDYISDIKVSFLDDDNIECIIHSMDGRRKDAFRISKKKLERDRDPASTFFSYILPALIRVNSDDKAKVKELENLSIALGYGLSK